MDLNQYKSFLFNLLPSGFAWTRQAGTNIDNLILAKASELQRVDNRLDNLLTEAYPLTSFELLTDWERITGLPEGCEGAATTIQLRREAVDRKLSSIGGQSKAFYEDVAARLGYDVEISDYKVFRAGSGAAGDALNDAPWGHAFRVDAPAETIRSFRAGSGAAGEPLSSWGNQLLECVMNRIKPAHTIAIYTYGA